VEMDSMTSFFLLKDALVTTQQLPVSVIDQHQTEKQSQQALVQSFSELSSHNPYI